MQERPSNVLGSHMSSQLVLVMSTLTLSSTIFTTKALYSLKILLEGDNIEIQRVLMFLRILFPLHSRSLTNLFA